MSYMNVSAESLAECCGVASNGQDAAPDILKIQLGVVQSWPQIEQKRAYHELAAKYMPSLVEKFRTSDVPWGSTAVMLDVISFTPFFVRFLQTSAGQGLSAVQVQRMIASRNSFNPSTQSLHTIAEVCQFLATLLVLEGTEKITADEQKSLEEMLSGWLRSIPPVFASETCERCLTLLSADQESRFMANSVKGMLEKALRQCGGAGCDRETKDDGSALMQCGRCKCAVYCGTQHQKQAWSMHKSICFASSF
ncbi:uncharacterized protein EV420DRAFT_1538791 [Desarmillaria tabescens]|uniref:MYND-type domain-containing protein n=1 Tax=Armillaria tabescens TaxID=1929756 RepID=A0AA39KE83_ARMTA|nr:uncharacterized protein EV420DRAFT_1538791 [Desarmillaria tabescens]KAK0459188.1 hypothetical protein EV420DRAFT_1538791 [Desarmillaria tabescens]